MEFSTKDGNPLIFNAHIGDGLKKSEFPEKEDELMGDEMAQILFKISSMVPVSYRAAAQKQGLEVRENSKGFVSNADPETLIKFINFGSSGGTDKIG